MHHFRTAEAAAVRSFRRARKFPVLGAKGVRRIHPYNEPRTNRESGGQVIPTFKMGARGITGRQQRITTCQEVTAFREAHADANRERRAGKNAIYPAGTYKMRIEYGATVASPGPGAIVTGPGMTLPEAADLLERSPVLRKKKTQTVSEVVAAFRDEAKQVLEEDRMVFNNPGDVEPTEPVATGERPPLEAQHRATSRRESRAARITVLRDYRRGRPKKPKGHEPPKFTSRSRTSTLARAAVREKDGLSCGWGSKQEQPEPTWVSLDS